MIVYDLYRLLVMFQKGLCCTADTTFTSWRISTQPLWTPSQCPRSLYHFLSVWYPPRRKTNPFFHVGSSWTTAKYFLWQNGLDLHYHWHLSRVNNVRCCLYRSCSPSELWHIIAELASSGNRDSITLTDGRTPDSNRKHPMINLSPLIYDPSKHGA